MIELPISSINSPISIDWWYNETGFKWGNDNYDEYHHLLIEEEILKKTRHEFLRERELIALTIIMVCLVTIKNSYLVLLTHNLYMCIRNPHDRWKRNESLANHLIQFVSNKWFWYLLDGQSIGLTINPPPPLISFKMNYKYKDGPTQQLQTLYF